jgi:hypothetical protein
MEEQKIKEGISQGIEEYKKQNQNNINMNIDDEELKKNIDNLNEQSQVFKNQLQEIKNKCYEEMNQKYSKILEEKIQEIQKTILQDVQKQNQQILNDYVKKFEDLEQKRENDYNEMSKVMLSGIQKEGGEILFSNIKVTHHGIKCDKCGVNPIVGYRYKCTICKKFNLCQMCEEKNSESQEHKHNFIKMRAEEKKNEKNEVKKVDENKNKPKGKENKKEKEKVKEKEKEKEKKVIDYQYELLNSDEILKPKEVEEEVESVSFSIFLKNNINLQWPDKKTKLIVDNDSELKIKGNQEIALNPLNVNQFQKIEIELDLKNVESGEHLCLLNFNVNGKNYGNQLILTIKVKDGKISEFRQMFDLSKEDYTKERLSKLLKEKNYKFTDAFGALFN